MKVLVVTAATNSIPRFRIDMIDEFVARGCDVAVLGDEPEKRWRSFFEEHGVRYRSYPVARNGMNPAQDMRTKRALEALFREEAPDAIFTYQAKPNIYGCLAAHAAGVADVYVMMGGLGSVFHASGVKNAVLRSIVSLQYRAALAHAKAVFFQNEEDVALFERLGIMGRSKAVMVRGSGVNLKKFPCKKLPGRKAFLFVGRLVRGKGVLDYLDAARMVKKDRPDVDFHLVGPFDSNPTALQPSDLQPYIDDGTVLYHGEQAPADIAAFLEKASVFVLPSYYGEGTPKSALEAMATGRTLIVADAVGCREVVREGVNGFLVPPKNPAALADAMRRSIDDDASMHAMAAQSRRMAEEVFDVDKVNGTICATMGIGR
ncbi:MAG: glycosyltransferase family 4 protein [Slackia sp.]